METRGYTLEEIAVAFDGSTAQLVDVQPYTLEADVARVEEGGASQMDDKRDV